MKFFMFFSKDNKKSKDIAKERLLRALMSDQLKISPQLLEQIKEDIVGVVCGYFEVDESKMDSLDLNVTNMIVSDEDLSMLISKIPVLKLKREKLVNSSS